MKRPPLQNSKNGLKGGAFQWIVLIPKYIQKLIPEKRIQPKKGRKARRKSQRKQKKKERRNKKKRFPRKYNIYGWFSEVVEKIFWDILNWIEIKMIICTVLCPAIFSQPWCKRWLMCWILLQILKTFWNWTYETSNSCDQKKMAWKHFLA